MARLDAGPQWEDSHPTTPITQIERTFTDILIVGDAGTPLSVVERNTLTILQWFQDEGIMGASVRVSVPGGDDFTYRAAVPS